MLHSEYIKVYEGNFILVNRINDELQRHGIVPVIKDESESYRLAGVAPSVNGFQEVYVNNEELEKAITILERIKAEMHQY